MSERAPGDHFSGVAGSYAEFRPTYPRELFELVASLAPRRGRVWECGAGSGQATIALADFFDRVIATDISAAQVARGPAHPKVEWIVAPAEHVPIESGTVDLVAVAQALHWFDFHAFFAECRRVAAPNAVLAAWTYGSPSMEGDVGRALSDFMYGDDGIGPYWPPERHHIHAEYETIPFPFERIETPRMELVHEWVAPQVIGYLRSMAATARYIEAHGRDPVDRFEERLAALWPAREARRIAWPLIIRALVIPSVASAASEVEGPNVSVERPATLPRR
jgi:SAM-dependent methyltransferase